jgi:hypothetical protein
MFGSQKLTSGLLQIASRGRDGQMFLPANTEVVGAVIRFALK